MATTKRPAGKAVARPATKARRGAASKAAGAPPRKEPLAAAAKRALAPSKKAAGPSPKTARAPAAAATPATGSRANRLAGNGSDQPMPSYQQDWKALGDPRQSIKRRIAALQSLGWEILADKARFRSVLGLVSNRDEPMELRLEALSAVQSATFDANRFAAFRPDYLRALRALSRDPDMELRQRVLGFLAREHDAPTQEALLQGLRDRDTALLPPEKALQLLGYDVHTEAYAAAREIVEKPPNPLARREALRLLSADGASAPMFEKIVLDKREGPEIRQLAASALHKLAPQKMQECARQMMLDESEDGEMKSVSLTALANFGGEAVRQDEALREHVQKLRGASSQSAVLRRAAVQFLERRPGRSE